MRSSPAAFHTSPQLACPTARRTDEFTAWSVNRRVSALAGLYSSSTRADGPRHDCSCCPRSCCASRLQYMFSRNTDLPFHFGEHPAPCVLA
eukprot:scaffold4037_cov400-Prasinococcus_capsulatus_cf.AAC.2